MSTTLLTRRRWYQFGLGRMMLLVTVFAVFLAWQQKIVSERLALVDTLATFSEEFEQAQPPGSPIARFVQDHQNQCIEQAGPTGSRLWPRMRGWFGDEPIWVVMTEDKEVFEKAKSLFPEALVLLCHRFDEEGQMIGGP
jgi:hypothetical protein